MPDSQSSEGHPEHVRLEKSTNFARRRGGRRIPGPGKRLGRPPGTRNRTKTELEEELQKKLREKAETLQLRQQLGQGTHRLNWKMHPEPAMEVQSGEPGPSAVVPPWRLPNLPASLSGTELLDLLAQARANRERDWLMILVAAWHGLSAAEVVGFKRDAVQNGYLTIQRIKGIRTTTQPLVQHKNPLLNEKAALIEFMRETPPGRPVFNLSTKTFWRIVQRHGKAAGISEDRATPRVLKHSMAIQSLSPGDVKLAEAERLIAELKVKAEKLPHRPRADKRAARVYQLRKELKWKAVHARIEREFNIHTTLNSLQSLLKRYLKRYPELPNPA